jgi:hypothetical protein
VPTVFKILCHLRLFRRAHPLIGAAPPPVAQSVFKGIFVFAIHKCHIKDSKRLCQGKNGRRSKVLGSEVWGFGMANDECRMNE